MNIEVVGLLVRCLATCHGKRPCLIVSPCLERQTDVLKLRVGYRVGLLVKVEGTVISLDWVVSPEQMVVV